MRAVPELIPALGKQVRDRHHRRADDAERMLDAVHLQHFDEGFFGGHFHVANAGFPFDGNAARHQVCDVAIDGAL
jgi:hypothetical protein